MTPNWLQPMPWLNMPPPQGKSVGQGLIEAGGTLGTALLRRGEDDDEEDEPVPVPKYHPPVQSPAITEPPIPLAPPPTYGAEFRVAPTESPLLRRRGEILNMMMRGGPGAFE